MGNLAATYTSLGRYEDALVMEEKTLEFRRRVLPANHPDIGVACLNLCISLVQVSNLHRALQFAREALHIFQATLPPSHHRIKHAEQLVRHCEGDTACRL
jgi:hypothetical protein